MRIAYVTSRYPPDVGGIPVVVNELARRMARGGHEVEVFAHAGPLAAPGSKRQGGVLVRRFSVPIASKDFPVSPAMLAGLARQRQAFDVVHAHNYHALPALAAALARMRPLVFTPHFHGGGHSPMARAAHVVYRPLTHLLFRACAHIVCVSAAEAEALRTGFPSLPAPVTVVRNGVAVHDFASALPFDVASNVVLAAGRMEGYKHFDRVALVAELLPDDHQITLLGDGPSRQDIERLVADRGLAGRVRLLGRVSDEDLRRWFCTARVLVSMSRHEAFGLTLAEALAAGTPVVASDVPAHREIAGEQPSGAVRLVPLEAGGNRLAEAIVDAVREGLPAGVRVRSWEESVEQLLGIYESVRLLGGPRPVRWESTSS
jgi:glycosyltransferase involved in cell wall biosynthesis